MVGRAWAAVRVDFAGRAIPEGWVFPPQRGSRRIGGAALPLHAKHGTPPSRVPPPAYICIQHTGRGTSTPISTFATAGDPPGSGPLHFHWKFHLLGIQVRSIEVSSESAGRHVTGILRSERGSRLDYLFGISRTRGTARRYTWQRSIDQNPARSISPVEIKGFSARHFPVRQ